MALPLENIRVLDLTRALSGPFCTMILGDMGAEVIKVEPAPKGEMIRGWGPFDRGTGVYYLSVNRNKRSLAVDFRTPQALALLRRLAGRADVLVENFKPGSTAEMGLDYASLKPGNPGLVYASITGFGSQGPYRDWPGYDQIAQGMSGMMGISGFPDGPPTRLGVPLGDLTAGMWGAIAVLAAIVQRQATGKGQKVESNLLGGLIGMLCVQGQRALSLGDVAGRIGNDHPVIYPYGAFQAADGPVNVAAATEAQWRKLCEILQAPELAADPEFADNSGRSTNRVRLKAELDQRLGARKAAEWTHLLMDSGIPAGPIYTLDQVFDDPHVQESGMIEEIGHPELGLIRLLAGPARLDAHEGRTVRSHPPVLGEHSRAVLEGFGIAADEIEALVASGAVMEAAR
jgi:crotonobetainyl-CoA:carnitine CoA-transferase CaiB-like acyl-CoA transferase